MSEGEVTSPSREGLVSVVVVNYNGERVIEDCLRSVYAQPYRPIEVIVVDNGSTDGSVALIVKKFPDVRLVRNERNLGFAGGNNRGVAAAQGEYVVLLNNDTVVDSGWLPPLIEAVGKPGVGVVTSKVITENVPEAFYEMNGTINYLGYNIMRQFSNLSQVFFAAGTSVMFRRNLVGLPFLDEYFLYHEDVYLSWKLRLQGYEISMAQPSIVWHKGSVTTSNQMPSFVTFYQERNKLLNAFLFLERATLTRLIPYFLFDGVAKSVMSLLTGRKSFFGIVQSYIWCLRNLNWIGAEREKMQRLRQIPDREILRLMSSKVVNADSAFGDCLNRLSLFYAKLVGLGFHD
jgi:GT2 family glycosyltransferase